jgi:DNA-directed RNA polymerase subunit RPC12/RpoP
MVEYKCFKCKQKVEEKDLKKRFVCPNCGSKVFYKPRTKVKVVKTD